MADYTKDFPVTWDEMHRQSKLLARRLLEKGPWKGVAAVTRGGLMPACVVARELNIRLVETISVVSYEHKEQGDIKLLKNLEAMGDGSGWLIVDDLVDTGNTFRFLRTQLPKAYYAAVYAKPQGLASADITMAEVSQDTWIHPPWDMESQYRIPLAQDLKKS